MEKNVTLHANIWKEINVERVVRNKFKLTGFERLIKDKTFTEKKPLALQLVICSCFSSFETCQGKYIFMK